MKKISISLIVPVYNVEKYLEACLDSILRQTYKDFEIILVDDGSTDSSGEICERYKEKDKRIRVYHEENSGQACARNLGMEKAIGDYFVFVDSDDIVGDRYIELLAKQVENNDADLGIVQMIKVNEGDNSVMTCTDKDLFETEIMTATEALKRSCVPSVPCKIFWNSPCAKIYKKELFSDIKFPYGMIYEDTATIPYVIAKCEKISLISSVQYFYRTRAGSTMYNVYANFGKHLVLIDIAKKFADFMEENYPSLHDEMVCNFVLHNFTIIHPLSRLNEYYDKYIYKIMNNKRELWRESLKNPYLSFQTKYFVRLLLINPKLFKFERKKAFPTYQKIRASLSKKYRVGYNEMLRCNELNNKLFDEIKK